MNKKLIRKMLTAAGGPLINESTRVEKPIIAIPKKINKSQLLDDNLWEKTDNNNEVNVYPNLRNDKYVQEFFLYDYAPRFKRLNNFASQDYVNAALNIYKNTPINIYNEDSNIGGYQTGGEREIYNNYFSNLINSTHISPSIYLNEKFKMNRPNLVHELTHAFRLGHLGITGDARFSSVKRPLYNAMNKEIGNKYSGSGYSNSEKNILNNTYNMAGYKINYDPLLEKGTTNTEVRFRLWKELYDKLGRRPSLEETDRYIRTYDGEKLLKIIRNANAYGQTMYNNGMLINLVKNALINVAQNNSNNAYLLNDQTYYAKQGGRIRKMLTASGGPIHYSRTMDTDNLSKAANYVGKYVLKGLGAFGKFLNAGFTSPTYGTVGQVSYARNAKDAKRLRKQSEASEQAMGKAMTWVSPLNYGAALWNGHGLNARKGEEEVASWSPAWQAVGRLGELYVGPKAVKGVKSAPKVIVNTAAKAGVKPAKAAVVAREIKLATKNRPNLSNRTISINRENNAVTNSPDVTYTLYNEFGEPIGKTNVGHPLSGNSKSRMVEGVMSKNNGHKVSEDTYNQAVLDILDNGGEGLESGWSLMMPLRTLPVTSKFPHTVIGLQFGNPVRLLTGTTKRPILRVVKGNHYIDSTPQLEWFDWESETPHYKVPITEEPSTSLKFFERKPSKLTEDARLGKPKGDRNNKKIINSDNVYGNLRFIRNIDGLPTIKDGLVQLGNSDKLLTNFTTDLPFRLHDWYPNIPGSTYMVVSPRAFKGKKFYSIKPSDSFLSTVDSKVTPNQVRIISGDPKILEEAERRGMRTLTSDKLQDLFNVGSEITKKEFELGRNGAVRPFANADVAINDFKFRNRFYGEDVPEILSKYPEGVVTPYRAEVDKLISQNIGRPSVKDYLTLENMTGLDAGIINKFDSELIKKAKDPLATRDMFEKVYYPVTSQIEEELMNSIGLYPGPYYSFSNLLKLDKLKGNPIKKKQGGKMNILEFLKNGSGIHIKEKNKGKFTSYCGGKVTDECIRKAKASGNPTLVKRATFAANARKWKHKEGGIIIKAADGTKTNFFLKVGNFLNSDLGKTVGTGLVNAFSSWTSSNKLNNAIDSLIEGLKKQNKADINSIQNWALQKATEEITLKFNELLLLFNSGASFEQPSPIVFEHLKSLLANKYAQQAINDANLNSQEAIANLESLKTNPTSDVFSSLVNTGFDYLSNKFANKALDKNGVPSSRNASFYSNPYLKTQNKVGTINSNGSMNTGIGGTTYNWKTNTFGSNNMMNSFDKIKF